MKDFYHTLKKTGKGYYKAKGSKFHSYAFPVKSEEEIKEYIDEISQKHHSSPHVCYAWALGPERKMRRENDAGEPSGTAGKPIYGQILSAGITNVLIIVVRYFGGTKLGVGGLITAYKTAAKSAIDKSGVVEKTIDDHFSISYEYDVTSDTLRVLNKYGITPRDQEFGVRCAARISIRKRMSKALQKDLKKISKLEFKQLP